MATQEDITELDMLFCQAKRERVQRALTELKSQMMQEMEVNKVKSPPPAPSSSLDEQRYERITSYMYDQTTNAVKIYVELPGSNLTMDNVNVVFSQRSVDLIVTVPDAKTKKRLNIVKLFEQIDTNKCTFVVKPSKVVITLAKKEPKNWTDLLFKEEKKSNIAPPKMDDKKDPQEAMMDMMRKLYEEGDDDMKRTLNKAWQEGQQKRMAGDV